MFGLDCLNIVTRAAVIHPELILGERNSEFAGQSLDSRIFLLKDSVLRETVLATKDSLCINPLAYLCDST